MFKVELKHSVSPKKVIDSEKKSVSLIITDETPVERYKYIDGKYQLYYLILSHKAGAVQLKREDILKLFYQHNTYSDKPPIGKIEKLKLNKKRTTATAIFDKDDEEAMRLFKKVEGDFLGSVSAGIDIIDGHWLSHEDKPNEFIATKWDIYEVSLVNIPAMPTAKVGLSQEDQGCKKCEELFDDTQAKEVLTKELNEEKGESMKKEELKSNHPELYKEVFSDGVDAENQRIKDVELSITNPALRELPAIVELKFDKNSTATDVKAALYDHSEEKTESLKKDIETDGKEIAESLAHISSADDSEEHYDENVELSKRVAQAKKYAEEKQR